MPIDFLPGTTDEHYVNIEGTQSISSCSLFLLHTLIKTVYHPQVMNDAATTEGYMATLLYNGFWAAEQVIDEASINAGVNDFRFEDREAVPVPTQSHAIVKLVCRLPY